MTVQQQQKIVDLVMHRMALRHGSSTRRDFEVACLTLDVQIGSGNQASQEHAVATVQERSVEDKPLAETEPRLNKFGV